MAFDWRSYDDETIEYHFNPRLSIPDAMDILKVQSDLALSARQKLVGKLDIRYGTRSKETLDIFPAANDKLGSVPPALIFIHGGYWRMSDKSDVSHLALDTVNEGITNISLNYDLCPEVTLDEIVDEIRNALIFIFNNTADLNIDPSRIFLSGHSAGGHLVGMMLKEDWTLSGLPNDFLKGGIPLSPIFEPEVVMHTSVNEDVRLTLDMAKRNNVLAGPPKTKCPILVAAGQLEPEGFRQQSVSYVELCQAHGIEAEYYEIFGCHHFSALDDFSQKDSELFRKIIAMISG